jgi:hypothetical protein
MRANGWVGAERSRTKRCVVLDGVERRCGERSNDERDNVLGVQCVERE